MLDHVHRRHREARAIDDAADLAVEADVVERMLERLRLARVGLRGIIHVDDIAATEQGVVVEGHFRVEREHLVVLGDDQRIDLQHGRVIVAEGAIGAEDRLHRARHLLQVQAELKGQLARLEGQQADGRLDNDLKNGVRIGLGDLLDLHAAMLGGDDAHALELTIEHETEIELALVRVGELDIDALHRLAFRPRLLGDETLAEQIARRLLNLVIGAAHFDAASLAARAGVNLRLHHPMRAAELGGGVYGLVGAEGDGAGGTATPQLANNSLA